MIKATYCVKGSITSICNKCKRANCICKVKTKKKDHRLTYKDENQKTKIVYVPKAKIKELKSMIKNYQNLKKYLNQLIDINIEMFKENK